MFEINNDDMWTIIHALDYSNERSKDETFPRSFDRERAAEISNALCELMRLSEKSDEQFKAQISEAT